MLLEAKMLKDKTFKSTTDTMELIRDGELSMLIPNKI